MPKKQLAWLLCGCSLIFIFTLINLQFGVSHYQFQELISALCHPHSQTLATIAIIQIRLPMVLMAIMAGAGLSIAGLLLQRVTQNPLACPSLTGIEYGTALCVTLTYLFLPQAERGIVMLIAIIGGVFTYWMITLILKKTGASIANITLTGVAFNTLYYSAIQAIMLALPTEAQAILYDLNGSLQTVSLHDIKLIALPFSLLFALSLLLTSRLHLLDLDEFQAEALGVPIKKYRLLVLAIAILLATLLTSIVGPLLFFGLMIPHLSKPFVSRSQSILFCAIFGAAFLLIAQCLTQIISPQSPPPLGLLVLILGSPLLLMILRRKFRYADNE